MPPVILSREAPPMSWTDPKPAAFCRGPKFQTRPRNKIVKEGESVQFECIVTSNDAKTTWDKDRQRLSPGSNENIFVKEVDELRVLGIRSVTQEDAGTYRIVLENHNGRIDASAKLDVVARSKGSEMKKNWSWASCAPVSNKEAGGGGGRNGRGLNGTSNGSPATRTTSSSRTVQNNSEPHASVMSRQRQNPPIFLQHLQDMKCADGDKVKLCTRIQGATEVVWWRNEKRLPDSSYFEYDHDPAADPEVYSLILSDVFLQDAGVYICEALNPAGGISSSANLTVTHSGVASSPARPAQPKPKMESAKAAMESIISQIEILELSEKFSKDPVPTDITSATRESENISPVSVSEIISNQSTEMLEPISNSHSPKSDSDTTPNFPEEVSSVEILTDKLVSFLEVEGRENQESAPDDGASISSHLPSSLSDLDDLHDIPQALEAVVSDEFLTEKLVGLELGPSVESAPDTDDVTGYLNETNSVSDSDEKPELSNDIEAVELEASPEIESPSCTELDPEIRTEDFKEPSSSYQSEESVGGRSPSVMGPAYLIAMKEETVHIRIKYSGVPQPTVQWTKNGKEWLLGVEENPELSSVRIEKVSYDDSGRFVAKVSNDLGTAHHHCFLSVEGPPEPPSSPPLAALDQVSGSISISWSCSPYDGGSMLTAYIIQISVDEQEWTQLWAGTWLTYCLAEPIPGSSYRFRVSCANMYGPGPPSPASPSVHIPGMHDDGPSNAETELLETLDVQIRRGSLGDSYIKGEELGKGRFGLVFTVRKKESGEEFAGKIIRAIKAADKLKVRQEVEIMNILRHPKLLQVVDALENDREICIITEKVYGGELFERVVADDFTLTEFDCVGFMRQICDGVRFMHLKNIIHLDLKPENILCLTRSTYNIKIIDFGLSQKYDSSAPLRVLFGTPEFISPEIINYEPISPASDMWALGVITYVLLSGLSPFMGDSDSETFSNITQGLFDFDDEAFDTISDEAKDFISKLLIRRKERRMSPAECLSHPWLVYPEPKKNIVLATDKLKRFIIRRKWQKTGNAIRALGRMTNMYSSRRSTEAAAAAASAMTSNDSGTSENSLISKADGSLSLEEEPEPSSEPARTTAEEEIQVSERKQRQLIRQNRVDSNGNL